MKIVIKKVISSIIFGLISITQLSSCGTIFYQDRHGQKSGQIDANVVLLNGIGLLFYIIPGVIAFVVDYQTGAIYLPNGKTAHLDPDVLKNDSKALENLVAQETGQNLSLKPAQITPLN